MDRPNPMSPEELESFLKALSTYTSAIPDSLIRHYLSRAGFKTTDQRVERLVALAAQKFLADVSNDALAHSRQRTPSIPPSKQKPSNPNEPFSSAAKITLTVDDLERALRDYGVNLCKPPYFADSVTAGAPDTNTTTTTTTTTATNNQMGSISKPPTQPTNAIPPQNIQIQQQQQQQPQRPTTK